MIFFIVLITSLLGISIGGIILTKTELEVMGIFGTIFSLIALIMILISVPAEQYHDRAKIAEFHGIKNTIIEARKQGNLSEGERTALTSKIAEVNGWLASIQSKNKSLFEIWISDEVDKLEPIR